MVIVDVSDARYKKLAVLLSRWAIFLMKKYRRANWLLEISLVNNKVLAKNVLSIPATKEPRPDLPAQAGLKQRRLGEIFLNPTIIAKQEESLLYMFIHGFLHLIGYDHHSKRDTIIMEKLERKLLKEIPNFQ